MISSDTSWAWPWWTVIVLINIVNVSLCIRLFLQSRSTVIAEQGSYLQKMRWMGLVFALVAVYRSVFVSRYLSQMAWFDSIANSSLIIRTLAFAAELSFAGLFALALVHVYKDLPASPTKSFARGFIAKGPYILVVCIFLAQFFAYGGLIFKSQLSFAIEESLWTLGFLSILPLAVLLFKQVRSISDPRIQVQFRMIRSASTVILTWGLIYCSYGLFYHLPFESWPGAMHQLAGGGPALKSGMSALKDALVVVHVSRHYADWGFGFVLWHSAYFTVCVWLALFLMRAPRKLAAAE